MRDKLHFYSCGEMKSVFKIFIASDLYLYISSLRHMISEADTSLTPHPNFEEVVKQLQTRLGLYVGSETGEGFLSLITEKCSRELNAKFEWEDGCQTKWSLAEVKLKIHCLGVRFLS